MIKALATAVLVAVAAVATAVEPSLEVRLDPQRLGVEDTARLTVTVTEPGRRTPRPVLGEVENFSLVAGPSTENQFSWVNGVATSRLSFTYILQPQQVGVARIGVITVPIGEVILRSGPIVAEVVAGSLAPPRQGRQLPVRARDPFAEIFSPRPATPAKIVLRQRAAKQKLYLGEPLAVTVTLDSTVAGIEAFEWVEPPSYPGWWTQKVELPEQVQSEIVEVGDERYQRYVIARFVLVPLKPGELALPAVAARVGVRARSVFARQQVLERTASEIKVEVAERPQPPAGFSGAVGQLTYSARVEPESVEIGQSAVLTIDLEGAGNLPLVEAPALWPSCTGCETYPPEEESRITVAETGIRGSREWRMTLVPRTAGELRLEPVTLAVFDPVAGRYRRQELGPLSLAVAPPPATPTPVVAIAEANEDGRLESEVASRATSSAGKAPPWRWVVVVLLTGVLGAAGGAWLAARRQSGALPPRADDQSPADRARQIQVHLESWWFGVKGSDRGAALHEDMEALRKDLEAVRFAPGRADHTDTVTDLEERFRALTRRKA